MGRLAFVIICVAGLCFPFPRIGSAELPKGTMLQVRQTTAAGTRHSKRGDRVSAVLIAPVLSDGQTVIPPGSLLEGEVRDSIRLGLGLRHHTASMDVQFHSLRFPEGDTLQIDAQVSEVEGAKERVNAQGRIYGISPAWNASSSLAAYAWSLIMIDPVAGVPVWMTKMLFVRSPDPEILLPMGTELRLVLNKPLRADVRYGFQPAVDPLPHSDATALDSWLESLPQQRVVDRNGRLSDLVNLVFIGSESAIRRAFNAAGWAISDKRSTWSFVRSYFSIVERRGYLTAPMAAMTFNGIAPGLAWQKGFNTMGKRHHLRMWSQPRQVDGKQVWIGTATEDISIGFSMKSGKFTHTSDEHIDVERTKVVNDLLYTGCLDAMGLLDRQDYSLSRMGNPPQSYRTDGKAAVVRLNECEEPRRLPGASHARGKSEGDSSSLVLFRNDLIRSNFISIITSATRLAAAPRTWFKGGSSAPAPAAGEVRPGEECPAPTPPSSW